MCRRSRWAGVWLAGRIAARGNGTLAGAWWAAAVVAAGAVVIIVAHAGLTPTPGAARIRRGRQTAISAVSRAGADIAVLVLAALAGWQLRRYSAASAGPNGSTGIDPVLTLVGETGPPATNLLLVTGTGISHFALAAVVNRDLPAAAIRYRSAVLDGLINSPLQAAAPPSWRARPAEDRRLTGSAREQAC